MNSYLNSSTQSSVLVKTMKYSRYMSDKIKLYLDLVLDSLFLKKMSFSNKIMKELHELMEDENQRVYIQYSFLAKKAYMKFEQKGPLKKVSNEQLQNFAFLFRRIFEKEKTRSKVNDFLMYSLLRFASFIETPDKNSLIQRFREFPMIDNPKFWKAVLTYMSKNIYKHLNAKKGGAKEKKESSNNSFIKSVKGFFKMSQSNIKNNVIKQSQIKSFEEISSLLFRIGLEFDSVVDILLVLGKDCNIPAQMIKQILNRNKEVLHQQMTDLNKVKLTLKDLESLNCVRSYDSIIRNAKGLTPRKSLNLKSMNAPEMKHLQREFETKTVEKSDKILSVIKLSLGFLVVDYDAEGHLMRTSCGSLKNIKGSNLSAHDSVLRNSEGPSQQESSKGSKVKNILDSVRSYEIKGIDDFLESATKLSQASRPQSPKEKDKKKASVFNFKEEKKERKRKWQEKFNGTDDSIQTNLGDVLSLLMLNRQVYRGKQSVIRRILMTVWPLSVSQRKYLYIQMTLKSHAKKQLLDYEESSYAFSRIKKRELPGVDAKRPQKFGESFMKVQRKKGELVDPIRNDFDLETEEVASDDLSETNPSQSTTLLSQKQDSVISNPQIQNPFVTNTFSTENLDTPKSPKMHQNKGQKYQTEMHSEIKKIPNRHRSTSTGNTLPTKSKKQKPKPGDNIISLDVKRTHVERKEFDHVSLEQVLRNIGHPKMGNFAYYQGLNYIVAYILDIIGDPVETYNISITLMERDFRKYVNHNMDNLNILFYTLRRLIQVFLPDLASHIDRNENMEANATYANWFLTLFTTLKQFKENVRLLDQVFDIFMSKGWVGFFKCVLVIFYYLEEDITSLQSEEMIMFLNDFTKKGFELLGEVLTSPKRNVSKKSIRNQSSHSSFQNLDKKELTTFDSQTSLGRTPLFNFKEEVKEFAMVNKLLLVEFSMEYHNMREAVEKKWIDILRRVDQYARPK